MTTQSRCWAVVIALLVASGALAARQALAFAPGDAAVLGEPRQTADPAGRFVAVTGRLVDPDGQPVASGRIAILDDRRAKPGLCGAGADDDACYEQLVASDALLGEARAGADGQFTLHLAGGLRASDHVFALGEDARGRRLRVYWTARPGSQPASTSVSRIVLHRRREFVVIVQGNGQPLADAEVDFGHSIKRRTDRSGTASYHLAPSNESASYHLAFTVRAPGFATDGWVGSFAAGTTTQVITLMPETVLTGRLVDAAGRPATSVRIGAHALDLPPGILIHANDDTPPDDTAGASHTGADGQFTLHGLRAGARYRLTFSTAGSSSAAADRVVTVSGAPIEIVLPATTPLRVDVSGIPSVPPLRWPMSGEFQLRSAGISLEALNPVSGAWQRLSSTPRVVIGEEPGHAELFFESVPVGPIRIAVRGGGVAGDVSSPVTLAPGAPAVVPLTLAAPRTIRLQVRDADGRPVSGARVEVFLHSGGSKYSNTSSDGTITFGLHPDYDAPVTVTIGGRVTTSVIRKDVAEPAPIVVP